MTLKLVLDAGHGLHTPGKRTPAGEREWTFNNKQLIACKRLLDRYEGVSILRVDDPTGERDVPVEERTDKSNAFGADAYVSFHNNAIDDKWGTHEGMETFSYIGDNPKSEKLQRAIHHHLIKATKNRDRGMKEANFHVLRETDKCAAVLTESFFMDSITDIKKLRSDTYLKATGEAIALGIIECYGLQEKPILASAGLMYRVVTGSFDSKENAEKRMQELKAKGFDSFLLPYKGGA